MKVFVPNSNNVAKTVGKTLLALVISLNAHAYDQGQGKAPGQGQTPQKGLFEQAPGQMAPGAQQKPAPAPQAQSQCQGAPAQTAPCATQAQVAPKGKGESCAAACQQSSFTGQWGSRCAQDACMNRAGSSFDIGPVTTVNGWYLASYEAHGVPRGKRDWKSSKWSQTQIDWVDLKKINAEGASFSDVSLSGNFEHVRFNKTNMDWVTLSGTLRDTDFKKASLKNVLFLNANFDSRHGKRNNFDKATLENVRFQGGSLEKMTFYDAHLKDVTFDCAQIKTPWIFYGSYIYDYNKDRYVEIDHDRVSSAESILASCPANAVINTSKVFFQTAKN